MRMAGRTIADEAIEASGNAVERTLKRESRLGADPGRRQIARAAHQEAIEGVPGDQAPVEQRGQPLPGA